MPINNSDTPGWLVFFTVMGSRGGPRVFAVALVIFMSFVVDQSLNFSPCCWSPHNQLLSYLQCHLP